MFAHTPFLAQSLHSSCHAHTLTPAPYYYYYHYSGVESSRVESSLQQLDCSPSNSALQLSVNVSCHSVSPSVCQSACLSVSIYVTSARAGSLRNPCKTQDPRPKTEGCLGRQGEGCSLARCSRWMDFWIRNLHLDYKSDFDAYMRCTSYTYIYTHTHIDAFVCNWCTPNPTSYMGQPHTHRGREGNAQVFLCFCLLSFYYFIPGLVLIHSVCVSGASSSSLPEGERVEHLLVLLSSFGNVSSNIVSVSFSVCVSHRISWHRILLECVYTWPWIHTTNYLHTHTHIPAHIWVVRVCACK